ncbi:MAG TPA: ATP-binding protein [Candidatus Sulfotelmatobacter sp.]|nr:ATP-binding protein [Candidatus Sulfotelmatobacter sp.]
MSRSISTRLIACFVLIVLLMIAADAVAVWQFMQIAAVSERLGNADATSLAVLRVHFDIDSVRDSVDLLAGSHDARQFTSEATSIRQKFLHDVEYAQQLLSGTIDAKDASISTSLESLRVTLLSQLDTAVELANADEWILVRLRLTSQVPALMEYSSSLVNRVDERVLEQRTKALEEKQRAQQRLTVIVPLVGLLTLFSAAALGWYVTSAITAPLSDLTACAESLAQGDFQHQVNVRGDDELTVLGKAFNYAALQLQRLYENLRRSEQELRDVIDAVPAHVWRASPDGAVDFINERLQQFVGLPAQDILGWNWQFALHPDDRDRFVSEWRAALKEGRPHEHEVRVRRVDGQYCWYNVRNVPLRDDAGNVVKWYGTGIEIEDRKRAEEERETLRADLAHSNRVSVLGELTASISHELKQPIAATMLNASTCLRWLKRDQPDLEEVRKTAEKILGDGKRANEIIDHLRSLYKKAPPQRELVDVDETIGEMVLLLRGEAHRYGVSIKIEHAAAIPKITADRVQLQQVLMNLMLNGVEAMKDTGGILTVKSQLGRDGQLLISVSDTGAGLPPDKADKIFNAFFTTKPQGSGMGLAISRSIIKSHGGRLWATDNDARGATFQFTLPTAAEVEEAPATWRPS